MQNSPTAKCVIITDEKNRALVLVEFDAQKGYCCHLPNYSDINIDIINKSEVTKKDDNSFIIINTHQEISPWDGLFSNFPISFDYGYLNFADKSGEFTAHWPGEPKTRETFRYWDIMDKEDIELLNHF